MAEKKTEEKMKFEEAFAELEKAVQKIDDGSLSLDECLKEYERGIKLAAFCTKELKSARARVEKLQKGNDGALETLETEISSELGQED